MGNTFVVLTEKLAESNSDNIYVPYTNMLSKFKYILQINSKYGFFLVCLKYIFPNSAGNIPGDGLFF